MPITAKEIVQAAIPNASDQLVDHILWGRTAYPFQCSDRGLYEAARRWARAKASGIELCDWCDNRLLPTDRGCCQSCQAGLDDVKE